MQTAESAVSLAGRCISSLVQAHIQHSLGSQEHIHLQIPWALAQPLSHPALLLSSQAPYLPHRLFAGWSSLKFSALHSTHPFIHRLTHLQVSLGIPTWTPTHLILQPKPEPPTPTGPALCLLVNTHTHTHTYSSGFGKTETLIHSSRQHQVHGL